MEELRDESERHMDQLQESRMQAQEELWDCQLQLEDLMFQWPWGKDVMSVERNLFVRSPHCCFVTIV
jgi:hypothetical protein